MIVQCIMFTYGPKFAAAIERKMCHLKLDFELSGYNKEVVIIIYMYT